MTLQPIKIVQKVILVALIVAIPTMRVDAFAPPLKSTVMTTTTMKQRIRLYSTTEKEENQARQQQQQQQKALNNNNNNINNNTGIRIQIPPLGSNPQFPHKVDGHIKEFPTYEMKERFRKIRSPRQKRPPRVVGTVPVIVPAAAAPPPPCSNCPPLLFGIGEFFDTEHQLVQTVRENADVGKPLESSRSLADKIPVGSGSGTSSSTLSCGSASCTQGGWPSKTKTNTSQIFYLLHGFGCLTDMDGTRHYFGPGDTVVVPLGWAGRCDVAEDLHKIWFTLDHHETILAEETKDDDDDDIDNNNPSIGMVRAKVIHYHELVKWSFRHTNKNNNGEEEFRLEDPHKSETSFYQVDDNDDDNELLGMGLSCVTCFSPSASVPFVVPPRKYVDCFHILEGTMLLTPSGSKQQDEPTFEFTSGDTVVLPKGWTGYCEIKDPVKALRVKA